MGFCKPCKGVKIYHLGQGVGNDLGIENAGIRLDRLRYAGNIRKIRIGNLSDKLFQELVRKLNGLPVDRFTH